jgi:integrase
VPGAVNFRGQPAKKDEMQYTFKGFKATKPVARIANPKKQLYEVYFIVYVGKDKRVFRYKKGINEFKGKVKRREMAEAYAREFWDSLTSGWNPLQERYPAIESELRLQRTMQFNEAVDYCYAEKEKILAIGSLYNYKHTVKVIKSAAINCGYSTNKINEVQRRDIRTIIDQARDEQGWTPKSRNQNLGILKALLSILVDKDIIGINPAHKIKLEKQPDRVAYKRIDEDQREAIVSHLSNVAPDYLDFIYFIYDTGIRPKELHLIQISDINLLKREIRVRDVVAKNNKERVIPITDDMLEILIRRNITSLGKTWYLFSNNKFAPGPEPFWPTAGARYWRKYVQKDLGIDAKLYGLKHTGADAKLLAGIDTRTLKSLYGHSSEQMTEKYLEQLQEIHKQKIIANAPSFTAKVIKMKKAE